MNLLLILSFLPLLFSFKFSPMSTSINVEDKQKSSQFLVENDGAEPMAIELTVKERVMDEKGVEQLPAATDMAIFPPQIIIPPKEKRTIRVSWSGKEDLTTEKSYRVIAEQLPLDVNQKVKKRSGIQMLMKYMAALYVTPVEAKPEIVLSYEQKAGTLIIKAQNLGNQHQVLTSPEITFSKGSKKWKLKMEDLKGLAGENVLAKSTRLFQLSSLKDLPADAEISLKLR